MRVQLLLEIIASAEEEDLQKILVGVLILVRGYMLDRTNSRTSTTIAMYSFSLQHGL